MMMDSVWEVLGLALADVKPENKYGALALGAAALVITHNPNIVKAELGAEKAIVLGEGMGRIKLATKYLQSEGINAKWYQAWSKNFGKNMTDFELTAAKARNSAWLNSKIDKGYKVYDIGVDVNRPNRSPFYQIEQEILKQRNYPTINLNGY
ncbi:hypothetical protein [Epilithonimonas sp. UC225_85]|uniref:hypothetical protein n=1 Tax=Epilithonimonas sp. UC225_85 TaxID=3350167 RepID=UPI0036D21E9F